MKKISQQKKIHDDINWSGMKKVLCVRTDHMGNVIMTSPALRAVRENCPNARITLLTSANAEPITMYMSYIDDVKTVSIPWDREENEKSVGTESVDDMIDQIKGQSYDAVIMFTTWSQSSLPMALVMYMSGVPVRVAYSHENPYSLLTHWVPDKEPFFYIQHEVERQINLLKSVGMVILSDDMQLSLPPKAEKDAVRILEYAGVNMSGRWVVLHSGASVPWRCYSKESYVAVINQLVHDHGIDVVLTGSENEKVNTGFISQHVGKGVFDIAGRYTLSQLLAILKLSPLLISNNTGPVHMAASLGKSVVDVYALTNPQHTPWKVAQSVLYFDVMDRFPNNNTILSFAYDTYMRNLQPYATPNSIVKESLRLLSIHA